MGPDEAAELMRHCLREALILGAPVLLAALPWFLARLMSYTVGLFSDFHRFLGQG
jgi:flagellar biosynthesis protein FliQ